MSVNNALTIQGDRKIRLLSKKFKSYGIELTFGMQESGEHRLRIELHDDFGAIVDIYRECSGEFTTVILPISEQRRLRIVIYEAEEMIYQILMRIPAHYKPSAEYNGIPEVSGVPVPAEPETAVSAEEKTADTPHEELFAGFVSGDLEVDFSQISERAVRMIDFKR